MQRHPILIVKQPQETTNLVFIGKQPQEFKKLILKKLWASNQLFYLFFNNQNDKNRRFSTEAFLWSPRRRRKYRAAAHFSHKPAAIIEKKQVYLEKAHPDSTKKGCLGRQVGGMAGWRVVWSGW